MPARPASHHRNRAVALRPRAFGALRAADVEFLSETISLACCVTLQAMALPPSPTDTFCKWAGDAEQIHVSGHSVALK